MACAHQFGTVIVLYMLGMICRDLRMTRGGADSPGSGPPSPRRRDQLVVPMTALGAVVAASTTAVLLRKPGGPPPTRLVEMGAAAMGGLLSSSCCVLQLVLNSLSIGCAGFAALDRFRPFFLGLTFSSLVLRTWYYDVRLKRAVWRSVPTWLLALSLAFSPHVVKYFNRAALHRAGALANTTTRYRLNVSGMKCEACANGLKRELDGLPGVAATSVLFSEGLVEVEGQEGQEGLEGQDALLRRIQDVMDARNYGVRLLGQECVASPGRGESPREVGA